MDNSNSHDNDGITQTQVKQKSVRVTVNKKANIAPKTPPQAKAPNQNDVHAARGEIYAEQLGRKLNPIDAPFPIETLREQFIELEQFATAQELDRRGIEQMDALYTGFDHLYIIDDLLQEILADLPPSEHFGWEAASRSQNHLHLPTAGVLPRHVDRLGDLRSITCYALTHFGVASYTNDRAHFIGNIAGYLFMSYFFAHLKIGYSVTPMRQGVVKDFDYLTPTVADNTRLVSGLSLITKKKIYQLAVMCGQVSLYAVDKAIEKMLITEVNDFDKQKEQDLLADMMRYGG